MAASVVSSERRPRRKPGYEIVEDRSETEQSDENQAKESEEKRIQKVNTPS